ncbi:RNA polymerase sigma factor, partial [Sphingomonas sp. NPDC049708]|uniref:RNA polymerase sigma factor n=1 Tax=Sphingomonas sp. NPDC049708 TaxID=3390681 RepID=UPI003D0210A5
YVLFQRAVENKYRTIEIQHCNGNRRGGALPSSLKDTLILRTIDEKSEAETAEILGISQKAVETRLYRARARLAEILKKV